MHSTNEATSLVIRKCIAHPYCFRRAICRTWSYSLSRALHDCISSSIKFKTADGYAFLCTRLQRWKRLIWNFHKSIPLLFKTFKIFVGLWPSSFINWTICCLLWFNLPIYRRRQTNEWNDILLSLQFSIPRDGIIIPQGGIPQDRIFILWDGRTIPWDSYPAPQDRNPVMCGTVNLPVSSTVVTE